MSLLFLQYPKCSTCQKASKWLQANSINIIERHIVEEKPNYKELNLWFVKSGLPIHRFFNTSGKVYRENNIKDIVKIASDEELLKLLSTDGMLLKRPILVGDDFVLVGFNEEEWGSKLLSNK